MLFRYRVLIPLLLTIGCDAPERQFAEVLEAGLGDPDASSTSSSSSALPSSSRPPVEAAVPSASHALPGPDADYVPPVEAGPADVGTEAPDARVGVDAEVDSGMLSIPDSGVDGWLAELDGPCASPGQTACLVNAPRQLLICSANHWVPNGMCPSDNRCDRRTGDCAELLDECSQRAPGEVFCKSDVLTTCGPDLVSIEEEPCEGLCSDANEACEAPACGDGKLEGTEECDDPADSEHLDCTAGCVLTRCGDGLPGREEECDLGDANGGSLCTSECQFNEVVLNFYTLSELEAWNHYGATGSYTNIYYPYTAATIVGNSYEEWQLGEGEGFWWQPSMAQGWIAEMSIRVVTTQDGCASAGLWIGTGNELGNVLQLQASNSWAGLTYPETHGFDMDTTSTFHTYRVQYFGNYRYQLFIDGILISDVHQLNGLGGSQVLMFGELGGCGTVTSEWERVMFYPGPQPSPDPDGDADADGVSNALDNCATDSNADQADGDADGDGDACDKCPIDAANDVDRDGLCAEVDVCPDDPRNDQDGDYQCDTEQCAPYEEAFRECIETSCSYPPTCPGICYCYSYGY